MLRQKMLIVIKQKYSMQYFQAVKIGKERASKAQMLLFDLAGFAMLTLTTKKKDGKFLPVGEEVYTAIIKTDDVVLVMKIESYLISIMPLDSIGAYMIINIKSS